jgi:hypothetical protein
MIVKTIVVSFFIFLEVSLSHLNFISNKTMSPPPITIHPPLTYYIPPLSISRSFSTHPHTLTYIFYSPSYQNHIIIISNFLIHLTNKPIPRIKHPPKILVLQNLSQIINTRCQITFRYLLLRTIFIYLD